MAIMSIEREIIGIAGKSNTTIITAAIASVSLAIDAVPDRANVSGFGLFLNWSAGPAVDAGQGQAFAINLLRPPGFLAPSTIQAEIFKPVTEERGSGKPRSGKQGFHLAGE